MRQISLIDQLEKILLIEATSKQNTMKTDLEEDFDRILSLDDFPEEVETGNNDNANSLEYKETLDCTVKVFAEHPETAFFNLGESDIKLLAKAYQGISNNFDMAFNARSLVKYAGMRDASFKDKIDYLTSILDRNIFTVTRSYDCYRKRIDALLDSHFSLSTFLLNIMMGSNCKAELQTLLDEKLESNDSPLEVIWDYFDKLLQYCSDIESTNCREVYHYFGHIVLQYTQILWHKVSQLPDGHSLKRLVTEFGLDEHSSAIVLFTHYYSHHVKENISVFQLSNLISASIQAFDDNCSYLSTNGELLKQGLIRKTEQTGPRNWDLELSGKLLQRVNELQKSDQGDDLMLNNSEYFQRISPSQTLDQLILPKDELMVITTIIQRLQNPNQQDIANWGLIGASLTSDQGVQNGCNILLHGAPGTGKTFVAGVFANELKRPLIQINANEIRHCFYGSTEKWARELFQEMRALAASSNPVFLLNEGDQLIHNRLKSTKGSVDNTENTIQSIFLEELEIFSGTIIVTTNLIENLDFAMGRRFHYKLELPLPGYEARFALWRLHLPNTIPGAHKIDIGKLASSFIFSGGQIRIVVQNACHQAYLRGQSSELSNEDVYQYAMLESCGNVSKTSKSVGF